MYMRVPLWLTFMWRPEDELWDRLALSFHLLGPWDGPQIITLCVSAFPDGRLAGLTIPLLYL